MHYSSLMPAALTSALLFLAGCGGSTSAVTSQAPEYPLKLEQPTSAAPVFLLHRIGDDLSEGATVMDMNADGRPDVTSGAYWYEAPQWTRHAFREAGVENEFVVNCAEFSVDIDHDGDLDILSAGWQQDGVFWYENPSRLGPQWTKHHITDSLHTEGMWPADIDGDGRDEYIAVHYTAQEVFYIDVSGPQPRKVTVGGEEGDEHGVGAGDIDSDGKVDIVTVNGWYRQISPEQWEWRPEFELGDTGFGIQVFDVNADGRSDLIYGRGHSYGLFWLEQTADGWRNHLIDGSYSQLHNMQLADLDGDGRPELLTGKRYRGHEGKDPGGHEPLAIFYYAIDTTTATFERFPIAYNSTAGVGTQFVVRDLDGDGDVDIVCGGKSGQHWFENLLIDNLSKEERDDFDLLLNPDWPFSG